MGCDVANIANWLTGLGLEKYGPVFADAEIDFEALPQLSEDDLKELGLPLGPRRKIASAIARLSDAATPQAGAPAEAERRHLTVMFVDLVGSTALAQRLDPEDLREVITAYQNSVAGVVARFDGFVAKFMGDGVLCYFGWPRANEDDAERAVRAGLAIIAAVTALKNSTSAALATRIGVATGVVIVGDLIGQGPTQEAAVVGETPNLAARLQTLARPNQLVLAQETRSLLGSLFELEDLGAHELKGISEPVAAYAVTRESARSSRFEARQTGTLTPIVGREQELGLMLERWRQAASGAGQMIVVSGEAGIGKSRITQALIDTIEQAGHARMTFQCSPYHSDSAFHPIIQHMVQGAGFQPEDASEARLDKLERMHGVNVGNFALLAALLGLDASQRHGPLALTPTQQRSHTMRALIKLMGFQAQEKPLLLVFEDLHWIDPTTLEFLDVTLDAIADQRILILATARPQFEHGFGGHPAVTRFALNRLGRAQIAAIVAKMTGGKAVPAELLHIIASRTDGVPLFVEELTKTVLESGQLREEGNALVLDRPLEAMAIPSSLHDSLMARLDRLQSFKDVAQMAACIGRDFCHRLLAGISPLREAELIVALDGLIKAELVFRRGVPPDATYMFKHAMVRDAAYESLLKARRQSIHVKLLGVLDQDADAAPEVLARHAEAAGLLEKATELWATAGKAAIARPAYDEAIANLGRAIALLAPHVDGGVRAATERALELQVQLAQALIARRGYSVPETIAAFEQARALADKIGDTPLRFAVLYGLWAGSYVKAEHAEVLRQAEALVEVIAPSGESIAKLVANRMLGSSYFMQGRLGEAKSQLEHALEFYDPAIHAAMANRLSLEPGMAVHTGMAIVLSALGESSRAKIHAGEAERVGLASGHVNSICYMYLHLSIYALLAGDEAEVTRYNVKLGPLADEHGLRLWQDFSGLARGLLEASAGEDSGLDLFDGFYRRMRDTNARIYSTLLLSGAGWRALGLKNAQRARLYLQELRSTIAETGETLMLAEAHRLDAAVALADGDAARSEASLHQAIAVARQQGAKSFELRAAADLVGLYQSQGRDDAARAVVLPVLE